MLATFLIGLREGLEASLVISILVAYLVKTQRQGLLPRIWAGVGLAMLASLGFGALLTFGPQGLSDRAEETIAGTLSFLAVGFVTWMVLWMSRASKSLAGDLQGRVDLAAGAAWGGLALVAFLAVAREGLETAMFLWAATRSAVADGGAAASSLLGALLGLGVAAAFGYAFYRGALRINLTRFFTWTGAFLIVVAAGVLSYGVHDLQEAGVLPGLTTVLFDVSGVIEPGTWYATLLKGIFNFSPVTTVLEGVAWVAYLVPTMAIFLTKVHQRSTAPTSQPPARVS